MRYYSIHHKEMHIIIQEQISANRNNKVINEFRQDCLRLRAFLSVGEAFLFVFNASKVHQKSVKMITNWFGYVLLDLKNPTQPMTLKNVERSSWNWPTKFPSSMSSLHKNGFGFQIPQHFSCSEPLSCC